MHLPPLSLAPLPRGSGFLLPTGTNMSVLTKQKIMTAAEEAGIEAPGSVRQV